MEQITLGQIFMTLATIDGVIGSVGVIIGVAIKFFGWIIKHSLVLFLNFSLTCSVKLLCMFLKILLLLPNLP